MHTVNINLEPAEFILLYQFHKFKKLLQTHREQNRVQESFIFNVCKCHNGPLKNSKRLKKARPIQPYKLQKNCKMVHRKLLYSLSIKLQI